MGLSSKYPLDAVGIGRVAVAGSFTTANGANPTVKAGSGFTVVRTAEGIWTVTLSKVPNKIIAAVCSVAQETLTNFPVIFMDQDSLTASVFKIQLFTTANCSTTNFAASDEPGAEIHFVVIAGDSSVA